VRKSKGEYHIRTFGHTRKHFYCTTKNKRLINTSFQPQYKRFDHITQIKKD
jgi:hypothetical protein